MKPSLFCFLFLILVNLCYYVPNTIASPIISGMTDDSRRFKFHVSIQYKKNPGNDYGHVCGGSIISERFILTAAHCFITILNNIIQDIFYPLGTTKIIAGINHRNEPGIERDVIRVFIPSEYDAHSHDNDLITVEADIAVAELSADLDVSQHPDRLAIIPLEVLDPRSNAGVNERATFCGFGKYILVERNGRSYPSESYSIINRFMNVIILGRDKCPIFNTAICAINSDKRIFRTSCLGDSGAGLVYNNKIVGVLSMGPYDCNTLESIDFTRLQGFIRFIEEVQNPRGDHSNIMILDTKPAHRNAKHQHPGDPSSSNSAGGKKRPSQAKNYHRPKEHSR